MSFNEIVNSIYSKNKPIVFLDTCVFLDILRVPYRENLNISNLECYKRIKLKALSNEIVLVTNDLVQEEFTNNFDSTYSELEKTSRKANDSLDRFLKSINFFSIEEEINLELEIYKSDWLLNIESFSKDFLKQAIILPVQDTDRLKATNRVVLSKAPSRKGGSLKDCIIFESLLSFCKALRDQDFDQLICFVTSNTKDFGDINDCKVLESLNLLDIKFANQLHHAYKEIGFVLNTENDVGS